MRSAAAPSMRAPSNLISPRLARIQPAMVLSSVVLPTPLRPKTPTTSPAPTARSTPCTMWLAP